MRGPITPSSLKWLINRSVRLDGELEKLKEVEVRRSNDAKRPIERPCGLLKNWRVIPPKAMFGRSWLYIHIQLVAYSLTSSRSRQWYGDNHS